MYCLVSVILDQWTAIHAEAQSYKRAILDATTPAGVARPPAFRAAKGLLLVLDWDRQQVLGASVQDKPLGFAIEGERLHVALWDHDEVMTLVGGRAERRLHHPWFNHIHTIDRSPGGLLLSSAGSDLLAELNDEGELVWSMFMFDHVHQDRFRLGRSFDRSRDYNHRYLPAGLSTHPNSAIAIDDRTLLATLFSTGELVRVRRSESGEGPPPEVAVVLHGLRHPHSIRRRPGGFMVTDTEGGRVLLLDRQLGVEAELPIEAGWIQDAVFAGERLMVVANRKITVRALSDASTHEATDASNYVVELRGATPIQRLDLGADRRIYMVEPISAATAEMLAHDFGAAIELDWLRWETR